MRRSYRRPTPSKIQLDPFSAYAIIFMAGMDVVPNLNLPLPRASQVGFPRAFTFCFSIDIIPTKEAMGMQKRTLWLKILLAVVLMLVAGGLAVDFGCGSQVKIC